ncbi:hypothetical protein ABZ114_01605 [Streptomyces albidoflavus]|uniref:hypothetical protein n=1 Tax=Streptomyces albidoflavus TaxID=1886 RepID=UPI0033A23A7A
MSETAVPGGGAGCTSPCATPSCPTSSRSGRTAAAGRAEQPHTPIDAARALVGTDPGHPGDWRPVERHFRDGHTETWWAADARLGGYGPDSPCRLIVATTAPGSLPEKATWYLATNLPHPDAPHATTSPHPPADLAEIVRVYGLRPWIEQSCKQIKDELGWADFHVSSDTTIRRYQTLVNCRSPSAGTNGSPLTERWTPPHRIPAPTTGQRGGTVTPHQPQPPCWPRALRAVRSWLTPAITLRSWWRAWTDKDPPLELQALLDAVTAGTPLDLYRRV